MFKTTHLNQIVLSHEWVIFKTNLLEHAFISKHVKIIFFTT